MSALGHKRTYALQNVMSALPPKADMCGALADVRLVPIATVSRFFDYFVGAGEQRWRHGNPQYLGGLKIDRQVILGRRLHGQITRLLTLQNAINVSRGARELIGQIWSIGHQAAGSNEGAFEVDGR